MRIRARNVVYIMVAAILLGGIVFCGHKGVRFSSVSVATAPSSSVTPTSQVSEVSAPVVQKPGGVQGDGGNAQLAAGTNGSVSVTAKIGKEGENSGLSQRQDLLSRFPLIESRLEDAGKGRQKRISWYRKSEPFPVIRREEILEPDGKGGQKTVITKEVYSDHLVLSLSSMEEGSRVEKALAAAGWRLSHKCPTEPWMVVHLKGTMQVEFDRSQAELEKLLPSGARLTEDEVIWPAMLPNDVGYSNQWGMPKIKANKAWEIADAGGDVLVGICDTGVDYAHPDLAANIWTNPREIPGNNIDDDGNGYKDDVRGWDFAEGNPDPADRDGHGSHVAGIAAAVGFNTNGVIGVAPRAKIICCKIFANDGTGSSSALGAAQAYLLALRQRGEFVASANFSIGTTSYPYVKGGYADQNAFSAGIVDCFAAGNENADTPYNSTGTSYTPYILYVASTGPGDGLSGFSNRGNSWCDLGAPGESIYSINSGGAYMYMDGTSMATPHVTGAAALVAAANRSLSAGQTMSIITGAVDYASSLAGCTLSQGRLNAYRAVLLAKTYPDIAILAPAEASTVVSNQPVTLVARTQITSNTVESVNFFRNGVLLGSATQQSTGLWTYVWTPTTTTSNDKITAQATDDLGRTTRTWWRTRVIVAESAPSTPEVSIRAVDDFAAEPADDGRFVLQLSSAAATDLTIPLVVSGTATPDSDYEALPASVVVPAGELAVEVPVNVIDNYLEDPLEMVQVTVESGAGFDAGANSNATVYIHDNESEAPPAWITQPVDVKVDYGDPALFTALSGGRTPLYYRWRKGSSNLTSLVLNGTMNLIPSVSSADLGVYSCVASNGYGTSTSTSAVLSLNPVSVMTATGHTPDSAVLNAILSCSNTSLTVYAFWNTLNGGTNAALWTNCALVGTCTGANVTNVGYEATSLQQDTRYYYTFCYSNEVGRIWSAKVLTFKTLGTVVLDNSAGATNTFPGLVSLRGALTDGGAADIRIYWGMSDGGTDPASWQNMTTFSNVSLGEFQLNLSNVIYGLVYYYRCHASNSVATGWSPSSSSFTTSYGVFSENFDGVFAPKLPAGWTTVGGYNWVTQVATNDTPPNAAYLPDLGFTSTNSLISPAFTYYSILGPLSFRHSYNCEGSTTPYDGCVLEIKIGANAWQDIIVAGGSWISNGYSKTIIAATNPLDGRDVWGGDSGGFVTTKVNLPASAVGQRVQLRWMLGTDSSFGKPGWYVDTIKFNISTLPLKVNLAPATSVIDNSAMLNGSLSCSSAFFNVYAYWNKVNGGTNVTAWTNSLWVGAYTNVAGITNLGATITGLQPGTTYYYTLRATNACTNIWATNSMTFVTEVFPDNTLSNLPATGFAVNLATLNGILRSKFSNRAVFVCWNTEDGGTNLAAWPNSRYIGSWTNVTATNLASSVSGFALGSTYYYTFYGTNSTDVIWASPSMAFTTPFAPVVDNGSGAGIAGMVGVPLNGSLSHGPADVRIYWGQTDGGTSAEGWEHVIPLDGTTDGGFSGVATNLLYGQTYYYRCSASNQYGVSWSPAPTSFTAGNPPSNYRMPIAFTNYNRSETLTNFPVLVVFSNNMAGAGFDYRTMLSPKGHDLRFTDNMGLNNLNYEVEKWNTGGCSYVWVQVPVFSNRCGILATWGDVGATNQPAYATNGATWSGSYAGVWHMNGNATDSGPNKRNATSDTSSNLVAGLIGGGKYYTNMVTVLPTSLGAHSTNGSFSAWIKTTATLPDTGMLFYGSPVATGNGFGGENELHVHLYPNGRPGLWVTAATTLTDSNSVSVIDGSWHQVAATWNRSGSSYVLYVDGVKVVSSSAQSSAFALSSSVRLGMSVLASTRYYIGCMDEAQLSSVPRSSNWVWATWFNVASNGMFNTVSPVVNPNPQIPLTNMPATEVTADTAVLNASLDSSGRVVYVYAHWGTVDGGTNAEAWANTAYVGAWTNNGGVNLSWPVAGLAASTPYYFTFRGSNLCGESWASNVQGFTTLEGGGSSRIFQIISPYGAVVPFSGSSNVMTGAVLNCSVANSPVTLGATQYVCTGWSMTGNGPNSGSGTNVTVMVTNDAVLTWQWTTNYWIDLGIVSNLDKVSGWYTAGSNLSVTATAEAYSLFSSWSGETNGCVISGSQITIPVDRARWISAVFALKKTVLGTTESWLAAYNLTNNPPNQVEIEDPDNDGASTWQEYIAGTDPTNRNDCFRLLVSGSGQSTLSFVTRMVTNGYYESLVRSYALECQGDLLSTNWVTLPGYSNITATGQLLIYTNSSPTNSFYRVKTWLQ